MFLLVLGFRSLSSFFLPSVLVLEELETQVCFLNCFTPFSYYGGRRFRALERETSEEDEVHFSLECMSFKVNRYDFYL